MILASHIIVSGLLGATTQNYFLAAAFGFASHYLLDAIPHWDYLSPKFKMRAEAEDGKFLKEKFFWKEASKIALDILVGLSLLFIFLINLNYADIAAVLISIFFGVLPDALQFFYWLTKWQPLKWSSDLQHLAHYSIHKKIKPGLWPGLSIQIATIGIILLILSKF
jgi:hypothetical protein